MFSPCESVCVSSQQNVVLETPGVITAGVIQSQSGGLFMMFSVFTLCWTYFESIETGHILLQCAQNNDFFQVQINPYNGYIFELCEHEVGCD